MVAAYELVPSADLEQAAEPGDEGRPSFFHRFKSAASVFDGSYRIIRAHADALDTAWLAEFDRLGAPVFLCFMLLRLGLLSLSVFWGFLLVSPLWFLSLVSNERFLPSALQTGLIITLFTIVEPIPFVALMHDARSKIYHVLYSAFLVLAWREVSVFLVSQEALGQFVARTWVRDMCFTVAAASVLGCGAVGWTIWDGLARRLWVLTTLIALLFLQTIYRRYRTDD